MPYGAVAGVVFTPTRLVASVGKAVIAWRDGATQPSWTSSLPSNRAGIVFWRGEIVTADAGDIYAIDPASGTLRRDFFVGQLQTIGGSLFYGGQGTYNLYGAHATPT